MTDASTTTFLYFVRKNFAYTVDHFLRLSRGLLGGRLVVLPYEVLFQIERLPFAVYIFSDLERLWPDERSLCGRICERILAENPAARILNDPRKFLDRYLLLRALRQEGSNLHNIYRHSECYSSVKFPVFLLAENAQGRFLSGLLHNQAELASALERVAMRKTRAETLIVEYQDTRSQDGYFRKYGAFILGDEIIPRHLMFSQNWEVRLKNDQVEANPAFSRQEREYLEGNPHASFLREVARKSKIDYGRVDYNFSEGRFHIWEINTNPTIIGNRYSPLRRSFNSIFFANFVNSWRRTLAQDGRAGSIFIGDLTRANAVRAWVARRELSLQPLGRSMIRTAKRIWWEIKG